METARVAATLLALALASTAAAQPTPAPTPVMINCADAVGIPGGTAAVAVSLVTDGEAMVAGTQNDLGFDAARFSIQTGACVINPAIGPGTEANKELDQNLLADPPRVRALIVALRSVNPIPSGLLYTCPFRVADDTPDGSYAITNTNLVASTADGTRLPVSGAGCQIVVAAATPTPTPTPRCRQDSDCPAGQVCVDGECVTPTPSVTPTGFCSTDNDCPPGEVCVDHHCVTPTPSPTPIGFCNDDLDCPPPEVCVDHHCVTPTPTPQCRQNSDCPSDQVCIDGTCVTVTPTTTPTPTPTFKRGGGGGCNCEIDPGAPASPTAHVLAVLLPALLLALRWRSRRATR